jgi:phytoene dehydrogenase-like protein
MPPARVVIIGAGAAGVFTAYRLHTMAGGEYEIVLIEKNDRVGGNARSTTVQFGGKDYSIDCGAQFFYSSPQPDYVDVLAGLGLFDAPAQIDARGTGITLWDAQANERRLWIPSHLSGFRRYQANDWERLIGFSKFLVYAFLLDRESPANWNMSVDTWIQNLALLDSEFKDEVLRPFLYQFLTLDHVWLAGGWTNWFDSQEAALDSATSVAEQLSGTGATDLGPPHPVIAAKSDASIAGWLASRPPRLAISARG